MGADGGRIGGDTAEFGGDSLNLVAVYLGGDDRMRSEEVKRHILKELYIAYFQKGSAVDLHKIREELGIGDTAFRNIVQRMSDETLIKAHTAGGYFIIQPLGIILAEKIDIVPESMKKKNQILRTSILDKLAGIYEERGKHAYAYIVDTLSRELSTDVHLLVYNIRVLEGLGYVESYTPGSYRITLQGLEVIQEQRERNKFAEEFQVLSGLEPHTRGRELQKLLARMLQEEGWLQEEGVRTGHEDIDVIVHKGRDYFLIECKWEKEPIQAGVVRELYGKISNRIGVSGIIISISGFTQGAVKQVEDYAGDKIILLFGKKDFRQLVYNEVTFEDLLNRKYQELVTRRRVIYT